MASPGKTRVLTLIDKLLVDGGGERLALELTRALDPSRFERTLCVTRWDPAVAESETGRRLLGELSDGSVDFLGLERRSKLAPAAWSRLRRHLQEQRIDVLHAHKFGSNFWGTIVGRAAGVPVIVAHEHSWSYEGAPLRRLLDRHVIGRYADAFVAVSEEDRRRMIEVERIPAAKVRFIPNGMPALPGPGSSTDLRRELGLGSGPVIGAVSTVRPEKALDSLVRAAALLRPRFPELTVVIAGAGEIAELAGLAAELGIEDAVRLLGFRPDVAAVLGTLDVAVNCSVREGSPISVMEYMEAALPIVATRVGGVPDLVEDGVTGTLVRPGDPAELARAIAELLEHPERAAAMGERGRERRRSHFDLGAMARRVEALYDELLARRKRERA